ncbi:MAG: hypothetical protein ACREPN_06825 [Rudaea sp.]
MQANLLPRAFPKLSLITCYLSIKSGYFVVNTANRTSARSIARALGSFPAVPWLRRNRHAG